MKTKILSLTLILTAVAAMAGPGPSPVVTPREARVMVPCKPGCQKMVVNKPLKENGPRVVNCAPEQMKSEACRRACN